MKKISAIVVLVFCWVHCQLTAQSYFDLNSQQYVGEEYICPTYEYVNDSENGLTATYSLGTLTISEDDLFPGKYNLTLDKFGLNSVDGQPMLPMSNKTIQIPDGYSFAYVRLLNSSMIELSLELAPSRSPLSDNDTLGWQPNKIIPISKMSFSSPDSIIKFEYSGKKFGKDVCMLLISPIQYDSASKKVRIYKDFSFEIGLRPNDVDSDKPNDPDADYYVVQNTLLRRSYLILAPTEYQNTVKEFSLWKERSGFNIINIFSENWTSSTIEATIDSVYNSAKNLQYVLLIGDHSKLPGKIKYSPYTDGGYYISDYEYSQIAPSLERSIYIGRIPGRNKEEIENALSKIVAYEITPPTDSKYYSQSLHSAYFQPSTHTHIEERRFVRTAEDIRNYVNGFGINPDYNYVTSTVVSPKQWSPHYADGKDIPVSLQRPNFAWDGNTSNVVDFFKKGGCYALYRGHGTISSWHYPNFSMNEIAQLPTSKKLPFVFSVTCLTGRYDLHDGGFAQSLISKKEGGCIGVIAASEVSYSGQNDALINGMFSHWFKGEGCYYHQGSNIYPPHIQPSEAGVTIGEILEAGLERMYEIYPSSLTNSSISNYTRNIFHIFGDPSMIIHSSCPTEFKGFKVELTPRIGQKRFKPGYYDGIFSISIEDEGIISVIDAEGYKASCIGNKMDVKAPYFPIEIVITGQNKIPLLYTFYNPQGTGAPSSYNNWHISKLFPNPASDFLSVTISYETIRSETSIGDINVGLNGTYPDIRNITLYIVATDGKISKSYQLSPKPQTWKQDISELPSGTYIVALFVDGVRSDYKNLIITH